MIPDMQFISGIFISCINRKYRIITSRSCAVRLYRLLLLAVNPDSLHHDSALQTLLFKLA